MKNLLFLFLVLLSACVSGTQVTRQMANDRQIVFRHCDEGFAEAQIQADAHCGQYGKKAIVKNTTSHQSGSCPTSWRGGHLVPGTEHTTIYECE